MEIRDFINGKVVYSKEGQDFWITDSKTGLQMILDMRGWGKIQNLFMDSHKKIDENAAAKFQDEVGEWIAQAINEKMARELAGEK